MKTDICKSRRWSVVRLAASTCSVLGVLGMTWILAVQSSRAEPIVDTLAGGRITLGGHDWGYSDASPQQFNYPAGLSVSADGSKLFIADYTNNAIRTFALSNSATATFANSNKFVSRPVSVLLDGAGSVYVLNRGNGNDGYILKFTPGGNLILTNAAGLSNATAMALDGSTNLYVIVKSNTVLRFRGATANVVATATNVVDIAGTSLRGIAVMDSGLLALSDAGRHGIYFLNPANGVLTTNTGFNGAGDISDEAAYAQFNKPDMIAKAGNGYLVVSDRGNHRVKVVDPSGRVSVLYGVNPSYWVNHHDVNFRPGWHDGPGVEYPVAGSLNYAEGRDPYGVTVGPSGDVFTTETFYHIVRKVTGTGLTGPTGEPQTAPVITVQPQSQTVALGATVTFTVTATGVEPLRYQWRFNSADVEGANSSFYTVTNVQIGHAGNYRVFITNAVGQVTSSNATLTVLVAPSITTQPQGQTVPVGGNATFTVSATGTEPLGYQWRFSDVDIPGSTAPTFTRIGVQSSDAGNYSVRITNQVGNVISSNAVLTVATAPEITSQPQPQAVRPGTNVTFSVVAVGTEPLSFQWRHNNVPIPGENSSSLLLVNVQVSDAGTYSVNITNLFGNVTSSNAILTILSPPVISPSSGYYPMGRTILVTSGLPDVFYTTDGTEPTVNSRSVQINGSVGTIPWFNSTNDLRALRVKAFSGTNASTTVSGQPASTNSIGVPPDIHTTLYAGIGSTIVVPVVANLRPGDQIKSYQFLVTVTPDGGAPMIPPQLAPLSITPSDFFPVAAPSAGTTPALINSQANSNGVSRGLVVFTTGTNANVQFQNFATVALLSIPIPGNAVEGQTYSITVTNASATSDGLSSPITLTPMLPATIIVTNVTYTVGDSASPRGGWYNAGSFGNRDIDNSDVNSVLYASLGMRVPFTFSDVYDSMDAWPQDVGPGVAIRDGLIGFQDWQVILQRSLRIAPFTNNWIRAWATNGDVTNAPTALISGGEPDLGSDWLVLSPWYRQALVSASPIGNAIPGSTVDVPVFAKLVNGVTVAGLQFRAIVTPDGGSPALTEAVDFIPAAGITNTIKASLDPDQIGCGWPLIPSASFNFSSLSSNWLGNVRFRIPPNAFSGHSYTLRFANVDGAPDLNTLYKFESRRTTITVGTPALPVDICSDDWKTHFFGSITNPLAVANVDADNDGSPNWQEFLAGTDPWNSDSCMHFHNASQTGVGGQKGLVFQWLTAPGRLYEVQSSSNPAGGWTPVSTVSGNGDVAGCVETNLTQAVKFYRLKLIQ